MFFRFAAALILVVLISVVGIGLEKQTLEAKRAVSRQYFQKDLLLEMHAKLRLRIQELTAPSHLNREPDRFPVVVMPQPIVPPPSAGQLTSRQSPAASRVPRLPLLRWEHPIKN